MTPSSPSPETLLSPGTLAIASLHIAEALLPAPFNARTLRTFYLPNFSSTSLSFRNSLRRRAYTARSTVFLPLRKIATWLLLLLTFLEPPPWCGGTCSQILSLTSPDPGNPGEITQAYPAFELLDYPHLPLAELSILLFLVTEALLQSVYVSNPSPLALFYSRGFIGDSSEKVQYNKPMIAYVFFVSASFLLFLAPADARANARPFLRLAVFLAANKPVFRELKLIARILPEVFKILSLEVLIIAIYAWFGTVIFSNRTREGSDHFDSWTSSVWSLWILVTTANFPDIMMDSYGKNRISFLYFGSFLLIAFFLMINLLLAAVYTNYQTEASQFREKVEQNAASNLKAAFEVMDESGTGRVRGAEMKALFDELNTFCPQVKYIQKDKQDVVLAVLDADGDQEITLAEFLNFCRVLRIEFESEDSMRGIVEASFPGVYMSDWFQYLERQCKGGGLEVFIDVALALNAVNIAVQSSHELAGDSLSGREKAGEEGAGLYGAVVEYLDLLFLLVYMLEVCLRVGVMGWRRYYSCYRFRFDFYITLLSVAATVLFWLPNRFHSRDVVQIIMMFRLLRLVRLVMAVKAYQMIGTTLTEIVPICGRMFSVLFCIMYGFSALGVMLFGGVINLDPESVHYQRLQGSDFAESDYFANNFNDMFSSMVSGETKEDKGR